MPIHSALLRARWLGVVVTAAVVLSLHAASPAGAVAGYGDVDAGRFFDKAVQWSVDANITGVSGACFEPGAPTSRGETAFWIWNMEGLPDPDSTEHGFIDVTDPAQDLAVAWMAEQNITTGTKTDPEGPATFSPERTLTRAEFAAFLWRLEAGPRWEEEGGPAATAHSFVDVLKDWQQSPVSWLAEQGITTGTNTDREGPATFSPEQTLNRGQLITFLYRYQDEPNVTIDRSDPACDPDAQALVEVSSGGFHACDLSEAGAIRCWSQNDDGGQNDDGQTRAATGSFKSVSAGGNHTCAVRTNDRVACWGNNDQGQSTAPTGQFRSVSAGNSHTCGVRTNNGVACWGNDADGRATPPSGEFQSVSAGGQHSCGVKADGTVDCWGSNEQGQSTAPDGEFRSVSAGETHSCGVKADGTVDCWGSNEQGQSTAPDGEFRSVSAGGAHSCGVKADGTVDCWGKNDQEQLDAPDGEFRSISASLLFTCGVSAGDSSISCWGLNDALTPTPPAAE